VIFIQTPPKKVAETPAATTTPAGAAAAAPAGVPRPDPQCENDRLLDGRSCYCNDPALDLLHALIADGMDQQAASRVAFAKTPPWTTSATVLRLWYHVEIRRLANAARRQVGLPQIPAFDRKAAMDG
jgi:hypothetical protein